MVLLELDKVGNNYVITVPEEVVKQLQLHEGQLLEIDVQPAETQPALTPGLLCVCANGTIWA
jgi:bifunctional DNA-binding transcriptional regulator/antitoxin component of YhaV-PrlF toxin-antitoxin module